MSFPVRNSRPPARKHGERQCQISQKVDIVLNGAQRRTSNADAIFPLHSGNAYFPDMHSLWLRNMAKPKNGVGASLGTIGGGADVRNGVSECFETSSKWGSY